MHCWGESESGQLGFETGGSDFVSLPTNNCFFNNRPKIRAINCGSSHTAFVLEDGTVYTCGANEHYQLGHEKTRNLPEQVSSLELVHVTQVACGKTHTLVVTNKGQVYSWGQNNQGQCGRENSNFEPVPRSNKYLSTCIVIQVSCGNSHSLALSNVGNIFSWGSNSHGQLGIGEDVGNSQSQPSLLQSLLSLPIKQVASGGFHSFALTLSGALFGWGNNMSGQLGVTDYEDKKFPVQVKSLRTQMVVHVACGENHTAVLTKDGGVFTFGSGSEGQLGHNTTNSEPNPRKVFELMGSQVTQLLCGKNHTIAYVAKVDRIYVFGAGTCGQLGNGSLTSKSSPAVVQGTWQATSNRSGESRNNARLTVKCVYSGYNSCFLVLNKAEEKIPPDDFRYPDINKEMVRLTINNSTYLFNNAKPEDTEKKKLIETIFSNSSCLNASFLNSDDTHFGTNSSKHGVNLDDARRNFELIIGNNNLLSLISNALTNLIHTLSNSPPDVEALRLYLLLYECPVLWDMRSLSVVILPLGLKLIELSQAGGRVLDKWWSKLQPRFFSRIAVIYKDSLLILIRNKAGDQSLLIALKVLEKLNNVNQINEIIPYFNFYMSEINDLIDLKMHYFNWLKNRKEKNPSVFSFCDYPFIMDAHAKTNLLKIDATIQMQNAVNEAYMQSLQTYYGLMPGFNQAAPMVVLQINRANLLTTTLQQLVNQKSTDFKKPLKVIFVGEEAIDDGGVKKEFFMLIMKEILNPKYGMFKYYEDSRLIWFNPDSFESDDLYKLVGCLCGLAIYNNVIIDLPFPLALFKKLLRRPLVLEDFKLLQPTVGRGLQQLIDYEESDVESVFHLNFTVTRDVWGKLEVKELIQGGASIAVTAENKERYVESYVDYLLVSSVAALYQAFDHGFHSVCGGDIIELFQPQELQMMVIGHQNYDWDEFKQCCEYKGEYYAKHPTIRFFWEVFHEMPFDQKQKFLVFLTGSDRIPILGLKTLKISIQPVREREDLLPVAHTCFNLLDLPLYSTKEKLKEKLYKAIENSEGFALV